MLTINVFGQTIKEIENDLRVMHWSEKFGDKIQTAKKLQKMDPFNRTAISYISRYYSEQNKDSISIFFDDLISKHPKSTEPFLLRAEFLSFEVGYKSRDENNKLKIKYLKQGLEVDPDDDRLIHELAKVYYDDFLYPRVKSYWDQDTTNDSISADTERLVKNSTFEHSADSSLFYFQKFWELNANNHEIFYYPIRQLECYLNKSDLSPIPRDFEKNLSQCYFPISSFINLEKDWQCDFSKDYLLETELAKRNINWHEIQLKSLEEDCLADRKAEAGTVIYRFTWLRSFHHPIVIRIEKSDNKVNLYWKTGKGLSGYHPQGIRKSGKKRLNIENWENFEQYLEKADFENLPNVKKIMMTDGAQWTLEKKDSKEYKIHNTNWPQKDFKNACLYLLELTNIRVKEKDIY